MKAISLYKLKDPHCTKQKNPTCKITKNWELEDLSQIVGISKPKWLQGVVRTTKVTIFAI